jgi:TetR/AcrR family transcriptional repressor of nem operon
MKQESPSKTKLLETAIDMIWASSYGSVSVDDICAKAGVNKGSFYYFFKSKSDLAVAAFERHWEAKRAMMDRIFSPQFPPLERLDLFLNAIVEDQKARYRALGKMPGCPFCSLGSELSTQDENIRQKVEHIFGRQMKYIESLVRDLAAEGLIQSSNHKELAEEIVSYFSGVLMQAKIENSVKHVERLAHGVRRMLGLKEAAPVAA